MYKGKNFKTVDNDHKNIFFLFLLNSSIFFFFYYNESFITNASFHLIVRLSEKVFSRPKENLPKKVSIKKNSEYVPFHRFCENLAKIISVSSKLVSDEQRQPAAYCRNVSI